MNFSAQQKLVSNNKCLIFKAANFGVVRYAAKANRYIALYNNNVFLSVASEFDIISKIYNHRFS